MKAYIVTYHRPTNDPLSSRQYRLFLDLDGVLVDFEMGVLKTTGRLPMQLQLSKMWAHLEHTPNFFEHLPWTKDGQLLWSTTQHLQPFILTGLPRGQWAAEQKRAWCKRELGVDVPVLTCPSKDKADIAWRHLLAHQTPVLIDDRTKYQTRWEQSGGVFIHHTSAESSIAVLHQLQILCD